MSGVSCAKCARACKARDRDGNELKLDGLPLKVFWSDKAALYVPSVLMWDQMKGRVGARSTRLTERLSRPSNHSRTARRTFGYACGPLCASLSFVGSSALSPANRGEIRISSARPAKGHSRSHLTFRAHRWQAVSAQRLRLRGRVLILRPGTLVGYGYPTVSPTRAPTSGLPGWPGKGWEQCPLTCSGPSLVGGGEDCSAAV